MKRTEILMIPGAAEESPEDTDCCRKARMPDGSWLAERSVMVRRVIVGVIALLLAVTVVRNSAVDALAEVDPAAQRQFWGGHPRRGDQPRDDRNRAGRCRPQRSSAGGIRAHRRCRTKGAAGARTLSWSMASQRRLRAPGGAPNGHSSPPSGATRARCPRITSSPSIFPGATPSALLKEIARLANLSPGGVGSSAPYLAAFARDPSNWPRMRALFRADPRSRMRR